MKIMWAQAMRMCFFAAAFLTDMRIFTGATNSTQEENFANVTTTCGSRAMTVSVTVEPDFMGDIYPDGHKGGDGCFFFSHTASDGYKVYEHDYPYAPSCGSTWMQKENDTEEFSAVTFIQFDAQIIQSTDIRHRSSCTFTSDQRISGQLGPMVNGSRFTETNETVAGVLPSLTIVDNSSNSLDQNDVVVVGDLLQVKVKLRTTPRFASMVVTECLASSRNIEKFPFTETLRLTDADGCPTASTVLEGTGVYESMIWGLDIVYSLKVFAFLFVDGLQNGRNQLHFSCNVFLCPPENASLCAEPSCDIRRRRSADDEADWTADHSPVRRRREAGEEGTTVQGSVQVRMNAEGNDQEREDAATLGSQEVNLSQCVNSPKTQSILAVIVIVFIGLITTVVALTCLNHRLRRRLRKTVMKEKEASGGGFR